MNEDDESYYYNKQMQIDFTNQHYISAIVNEIEENGTTMKAKFVSYKRIN